jgi:hypothetical protein
MGPIRSHIQWVPGSFLWVKWLGPEVEHSSPSNAKVKGLTNSRTNLLLSSHTSLHGADTEQNTTHFTYKFLSLERYYCTFLIL